MHDGANAYPGAAECVDELRRRGKRLAILSNSARRAAATDDKLRAMGLGTFDAYVTGGECAWQLFKEDDPQYDALGHRCVVLAWPDPGDHHLFAAGLGERLTYASVDEADFVLLLGLGHVWDGVTLAAADDGGLQNLLDRGLARGIPLLCCNPDKVVVKPDGSHSPCPGTLASYYETHGGRVLYSGKPHPDVYRVCLRAMGGVPSGRVVAVGDSLHHDIAGALGCGIDSVLVTGGIHAEELGIAASSAQTAPSQRLESLYSKHLQAGGRPTYTMPAFTW